MEKLLKELKSFLKTFLWFFIACLLLPVLFMSFICVHYSNKLVNYVLSINYPALTISKSKKIRTLIDTPRNAGIFHFLLEVRGPCDYEQIKRVYAEHLTELRDKMGFLRFPKLRQKLVTCWGHYAWVKDNSSFNINNHVVLSGRTYRGRSLNDRNIQEFISDLVTKYISSDLPQWQVIVIPTTSASSLSVDGSQEVEEDDHFYILVKVHHLLIAEEDNLHMSEMLMLNSSKPVYELDDEGLIQPSKSPPNLSYFVRKPEHIQKLLEYLSRVIVKRWNAFIYEFESLETPDGCRRVQITNVTQLLSVLLIVAVNVWIRYWKSLRDRGRERRRTTSAGDSYEGRPTLFTRLLLREIDLRNLSWQVAFDALRTTWHPANMVKTCTEFLWQINLNYCLLLPYHIYCELMACRDLLFKGSTQHTATYSGRISVYLPLMIYAQIEFFKIWYEVFKAPVNIYEELFENSSKESNILQIKSYSGRKIVSFSKSIDIAALRKRIEFNDKERESDFALSCLAGAIHDYFATYRDTASVPKLLNTTCRTIAKGYFTENGGDKFDDIGGVVFLKLPLRPPDRDHVREVHSIVENIRRKQIMIYLASMGQTKFDLLTAIIPRVLTKISINFFAHNFPVTLTEIHGSTSEFKTIWGQKVEDVLLFRPPQSKTCLSLNIHRFGDKYRLAIMADTQLGPDHAKITRSFENYMEGVKL